MPAIRKSNISRKPYSSLSELAAKRGSPHRYERWRLFSSSLAAMSSVTDMIACCASSRAFADTPGMSVNSRTREASLRGARSISPHQQADPGRRGQAVRKAASTLYTVDYLSKHRGTESSVMPDLLSIARRNSQESAEKRRRQ